MTIYEQLAFQSYLTSRSRIFTDVGGAAMTVKMIHIPCSTSTSYSNGVRTNISDILNSRTTSPTILILFIFSTRVSFDFQMLDNSMAF